MSLRIIALVLAFIAIFGCASQVATEGLACNDTDGGKNANVTGAVTVSNGTGLKTFSDWCINSTLLREYYCEGGSVGIINIECAGEYMCENAACVRQPCTHSDQGYDRGTTRKGWTSFRNSCIGPTNGTEYYCDENGNMASRPFGCQAGTWCVDGECKPAACNDSDGRDIYTKGNATTRTNVHPDACLDAIRLKEYYCDGNVAAYETIECKAGCSDGICVRQKINCVETDAGDDILTGGTLLLKTGMVEAEYLDKCTDNRTLIEYYCTEDGYGFRRVECPAGLRCVQAACREEMCVDSDDGYYIYRKGIVTKGDDRGEDACNDTRTGIEYLCEGNDLTGRAFTCPSGTHCADGACK
jgi:hypothetical protein